MRVLQINSVCGVGSTGKIATDIGKILNKSGYKSYIAYGRERARQCDTAIKIGNLFELFFHFLLTRIFDCHGYASTLATLLFIKKIDIINPDIIHLHNIHGYYINIEILMRYLKKINKPIFWTLHDCWSFTGHCAYFDYIGCDKWKTGCFACPQKTNYPKSIIFDNSRSNYKKKREIFVGHHNLTIITPSKWLAKKVEESFLKNYPIRVINNGIDLEKFKPKTGTFRKSYNVEKLFLILCVANVWEKRKGLEYIIELSKRISEDEKIIVIGLKKSQMRKIPNNIISLQRTNSVDELAEIYSTVDVFVNPTLEDNFPTTNLESMACGTPVITFDTGGSVESITSQTGIIVAKGDVNRLLGAIRTVKKNKKSFYFQYCVDNIVNNYDKNKKFNEYIEIYNKAIL